MIGPNPFAAQFGAGAPGATVPTSQLYFNTSTTPYNAYIYRSGAWHLVGDGTGGNPGGADTQVQFNDAGAFGGNAGLTFQKTTGVLTIGANAATVNPGLLTLSPVITAQVATLTAGLVQQSPTITFATPAPFTGSSLQQNITTPTSVTGFTLSGTLTNPSSSVIGFSQNYTVVQTVGAYAGQVSACFYAPRIGAANTQNFTATTLGGFVSFSGRPSIQSGATGTISSIAIAAGQLLNSAAGAILTNGYGTNFTAPTATGVITSYAAHYTAKPTAPTNNVCYGAGTLDTGNWFVNENTAYLSKFGSAVNNGLFTVATLPTPPTGGYYSTVTDATLTIITGLGLSPVGGGANTVPVFYDGAGWKLI